MLVRMDSLRLHLRAGVPRRRPPLALGVAAEAHAIITQHGINPKAPSVRPTFELTYASVRD